MRSRRGMTLVELVVAFGIGAAVALLAFSLAADMGRVQHRQVATLETTQGLRRAGELLAEDLRNAGLGMGYDHAGRFWGLALGEPPFSTGGRVVTTQDGDLPTDDLLLRRSVGIRRTVLGVDGGFLEVCAGAAPKVDSLVAVTGRTGLGARIYRLQARNPSGCTMGMCMAGCERWQVDLETGLSPNGGAEPMVARGGDVFTQFESVAWFVVPDADGRSGLYRGSGFELESCLAPEAGCGGLVADGVLMMQVRYAHFDAAATAWVELSPTDPIVGFDRVRVDLELFARAESDPRIGRSVRLESQLAAGVCVPACADPIDSVPRAAFRTTVEVRNAGRLRIH